MAKLHDERERMPAEERERYLLDGVRSLAQHAYEKAPAMRKKFDIAGFKPDQIHNLKDLEKIPITTRDEFIKLERENPPFGGFLTVPMESLKRIYVHPGPQYETLIDSDIEHGTTLFQKMGLIKGDIVINCLAYHMVPAGLLVDEIVGNLGMTLIPAGTGNKDLQVQIMHDLRVTAFMGFPLFLMQVIKRAEELGYDFHRDFALRSALALGSSTVRKNLEEDYGIDTRQLYAFLPIGLPAVECEYKSGMHFEEDFLIEIVDPATGKQLGPGEVGEIVGTAIFNNVVPRIRFASGDLGYYTDEPCPCGRTSNRLVEVVGRVGDAVKVRGMFIAPPEVDDVVSHIPEIAKAQLLVGHSKLRDTITARFELTNETVDRERLVEAFQRDFQNRCRLKADKVEFVSPGTIPKDAKKIDDLRKEIVL